MANVELLQPTDLTRREWRELQSISRESFGRELKRSQTEIDTFTAWHDPEQYYAGHVNPNSLVGTKLSGNQEYSDPRVAVATEGEKLIGFASAANNVSGKTKLERDLKMAGTKKKYLWLSELAVHPDYQRQRVGTQLGKLLLESGQPKQPATAYVWPDEITYMTRFLERLSFEGSDPEPVDVFGSETAPVHQVRMVAPSLKGVLQQLK